MHTFWPGVKMEGWELDGSIYPVAREHMGLQQLEDSGALVSPQMCKAQLLLSRVRLVGCVSSISPLAVCVDIYIDVCTACWSRVVHAAVH